MPCNAGGRPVGRAGCRAGPPACGSGRQLFHQAETDTRTGPQTRRTCGRHHPTQHSTLVAVDVLWRARRRRGRRRGASGRSTGRPGRRARGAGAPVRGAQAQRGHSDVDEHVAGQVGVHFLPRAPRVLHVSPRAAGPGAALPAVCLCSPAEAGVAHVRARRLQRPPHHRGGSEFWGGCRQAAALPISLRSPASM